MTKDLNSNASDSESGEFKIHYHLNGGVHRMDATVRNRAEGELLALLKEVGVVLGLPVQVETHAYGEGGLVEYLDLIFQNKEQIAAVMALLSPLLGAPFYIDKIKQSKQQTALNELNLQKIKLEIKEKEDSATLREAEKVKRVESKNKVFELETPPTADEIAQALLTRKRVARRRSNYYEALLVDSKIEAVGFAPSHDKDVMELRVARGNFSSYVIARSDLEPLIYERISLEIVSPVLRSGAIKWRGIFDKKVVSFELLDQAFRSEVASQKVQFQNGTTLVCDFEVHQREDDIGDIEIAGYAVTKVYEVNTPLALQQRREEQLPLQLPEPPASGEESA
ncbi:hypothetical protein [Rhodoferax sp.]|uniref:hypothetical protein n=1 Tax=Rhodoferax sp. TaxID=50421 RepID=UPI002ACE3FB5|nr:hypothetical protein [Rhodoferax sp.]MDZ7919357.1 hypothetical protein [Rhodoferax sp.]